MNKVFTRTNKIILDDCYQLESDSDSGLILVFSEPRKRTSKTTGLEEDYIFFDRLYFPRISQALTKYVDLTQNNSKTLEELLTKVDDIYAIIKRIDLEFQQF